MTLLLRQKDLYSMRGSGDRPLNRGRMLRWEVVTQSPAFEPRLRVAVTSSGSDPLWVSLNDVPGPTPTARLRKGLAVSIPGTSGAEIVRNGPRVVATQRRIRIAGAELDWECFGRRCGAVMLDRKGNSCLLRSTLMKHAIPLHASDRDLSVIILLLCHRIPQSLSLMYSNWLP